MMSTYTQKKMMERQKKKRWTVEEERDAKKKNNKKGEKFIYGRKDEKRKGKSKFWKDGWENWRWGGYDMCEEIMKDVLGACKKRKF